MTRPGRWRTSRRRCGRWTRPPTRSGRACCTTSAAGTTAGTADLDVVLAANREAVRLVPAEPPSTARAQVLLGYGRALHIQAGRYEEAAAVDEQALTAARRAGSQPDVARAMAAVGYLRAVTGEVDAGIALLREACALTGRPAGRGQAPEEFLGRTGSGGWRGWSSAAQRRAGENQPAGGGRRGGRPGLGGAAASGPGRSPHRVRPARLRGEALFGLGRWDEAAQISEPLACQPVSFANTILQAKLAELEAARGQPEAALARLDRVREQRLAARSRACPGPGPAPGGGAAVARPAGARL